MKNGGGHFAPELGVILNWNQVVTLNWNLQTGTHSYSKIKKSTQRGYIPQDNEINLSRH
jgi:hypothetical protein